jgi:uncharacterized protein (TIGR03435 family)
MKLHQTILGIAAPSAVFLFVLLSAPLTDAQSPAVGSAPPAFEVASIKPNKPSNSGVTGDCHGSNSTFPPGDPGAAIPRGRCVITAARLSHLIAIAYKLPIPRISGGPNWVWGAERFDIAAKAENANATHEELISMLQTLMADRFKLRFHRETREISGYALVVGRNGHKLKQSKSSDDRPSITLQGAGINKFDAVDRKNLDLNTVTGRRISMSQFANALSNLPNAQPVVDKTGLTGLYDFAVSWEPDESPSAVLQQQLGLRVEQQKVPVEFLIIDSAEIPAEN